MKSEGASDALARTVAVNAITIGQIFYLLNSRYLLELVVVAESASGQQVSAATASSRSCPAVAVHLHDAVPGDVRQRSRSRFAVWPWLLAGGLVFFLVVEAEKFVIRSSASLRTRSPRWRPGRERACRSLTSRRLSYLASTDLLFARPVRGGAPGVTRKRFEIG